MLHTWMKSEKGAVLPLMGLAFIVLLLSTGLAIDYARALIVKERLQWALDAAALAGTKKATTNQAAVQQEAQAYFDANFPVGYMSTSRATVNATPIPSIDSGGYAYKFTVNNVSMDTYIMTTVGLNDIGVGVSAEVNTLPLTPLDVVFSVDMSGSMQVTAGQGCVALPYDDPSKNCYSGTSKLADAKVAMLNLVNQLDSGKPDTRFGIVPWSSYVNGLGVLKGQKSVKCFDDHYASLVANTIGSPWIDNAAAPIMEVPSKCREFVEGTIENVGSLRPMLPLTSTISTVTAAINDLKAEANTDGSLGMYWSYAMLQVPGPWVAPITPSVNKSIVLLTDGVNTKYYDDPSKANLTTIPPKTNKQQLEYCQLAKNAGIAIYTIAYDIDDNDPVRVNAKNMLRACASDTCPTQSGSKCYFDARYPADLYAAMKTIGNAMMTMRLTK